MSDSNTINRAMGGLGSTIMRAGERLKQARKDFGHAHEPRQKLISATLAALIACGVVALLMTNWGDSAPLDYVELPTRDLRVNWLEDNSERDPDILLITIDEEALAYGDYPYELELEGDTSDPRYAWPWPRHVYNKIIRYCREGGARVIVFDAIFTETGPNTNELRTQRDISGQSRTVWTIDRAGDDLFIMEATARPDVAVAMTHAGAAREPESRDELIRAYTVKLEGDEAVSLHNTVSWRYSPYRSQDVPFRGLLDGWPDAMLAMREDPKALEYLGQLRKKINKDDYLKSKLRLQSVIPLTETESPRGIGGVGTVMAFHDADGNIRRYDVLSTFGGDTYRSLPLETWRLYVLSYASDVVADRSKLETFEARFPGLSVEENSLVDAEASYELSNELRDVPVSVTDGTAQYLGRTIPLDDTGRMEIRYRNWLSVRDMPSYERHKQELDELYADRPPFAIYPQISAKDILKDWDFFSANEKSRTQKLELNEEINELEALIPDASEEDRVYLEEDLQIARDKLDKLNTAAEYELAHGHPSNLMRDKVVFVAWTATALGDRHQTPLDPSTPGTWVVASAFDNLKNHDFMVSLPPWLDWFTALIATVLAVFGVMYSGRLLNGLLLVLAMGAAAIVASWLAFEQQLWIGTAAPLAGLMFGFSHGALAKALTEGRQRKQRENFARQYMGKELLDYVIKNPGSLKLGGENKEMSIFFSDVAGFTTVTETLGPENPERLVELLNVYLERMTDIMLGTGGVIDKYIGDAIMCFWGAPMTQEDHAVRACRGALLCRTELARMQPLFADAVRGIAPQLIKPDGEVLYARAGINTGIVTVGNMGSSKRFAYTVMGDAVNLAARLEPQCKGYGTDILIGEKTEEKIRGEFTLRPIDLMVVKGKSEPVEVFELMGEKDVPQFIHDLLEHWNKGVQLFRAREFEAALESFKNAEHHETMQEDGAINPSRLYIERCEDLIANPPPPEWNGVFVKTSK